MGPADSLIKCLQMQWNRNILQEKIDVLLKNKCVENKPQ
jgi:hypothetical protein